jgi:outer membrane murein-binding lipoprotein Lpp
MNKTNRRFIVFGAVAAALALAGCTSTAGGLGNPLPRLKTVVVTDFAMAPDLVLLDRGYTARLEHKSGALQTSERKPRTVERVNDEIVASIVATLREAGLEAQPGSEDTLTLNDEALVVGGRLRPGEQGSVGKNKPIGFAVGHGGVVAEMTVSYFSSRGKQQLLRFSADAKGAGKPLAGKQAKAYTDAIAAVLKTENGSPEKLSPDVEVQARRIGRAAGDRIVAYAKERGWLEKPEGGDAEAAVKLPNPKPAQKPAKKPAKPAA